MGRYVAKFEALIAEMARTSYALATSSGTTALHLALLAVGVRRGDKVVVPSCSYVATANAVLYCGAIPIFVDVRPDTWTLDLEAAERAVETYGAAGVVTVNLFGAHCGVPKAPWVVEDACESHGVLVSEGADAAVFSFYGNKIVTCGEGGAVVTRRQDLFEKCRLLRGQGTTGATRYVHEMMGFNYRLTDLQAAIGCAQIEKLPEMLRRRQRLRMAYEGNLPSFVQRQRRGVDAVDWVMPVVISGGARRDAVVAALEEKGIETRPVFPPMHRQPYLWSGQSLAVSERLGTDGLLLPLHLGMTENDVVYICKALRSAA
jgi:perosamine synthetase